jgi:hypothetical protein
MTHSKRLLSAVHCTNICNQCHQRHPRTYPTEPRHHLSSCRFAASPRSVWAGMQSTADANATYPPMLSAHCCAASCTFPCGIMVKPGERYSAHNWRTRNIQIPHCSHAHSNKPSIIPHTACSKPLPPPPCLNHISSMLFGFLQKKIYIGR